MKNAIILTGSTGGLGSALATLLAEDAQAQLYCLYRNSAKFEALSRRLPEGVKGYRLREHDDFSALTHLLEAQTFEEIILILNAFSIAPLKRVGDFSREEIAELTEGNLTQNITLLNRVIHYCHRHSLALRVIHIDSGAADRPLTGWSHYCAGKSYMNAFLSVVAAEHPAFRVVSFDPGVMDTDMQAQIRSADKGVFDEVERFIAFKEEQRLSAPAEVARQIKERYITDWTAEAPREKKR